MFWVVGIVFRVGRRWTRLLAKLSYSLLFRLASIVMWAVLFLVFVYNFLPEKITNPLRNNDGSRYQARLGNIGKYPFDPTKPKLVILLGYQRVGSTFTGEIFNQNPKAFYMFEPVDGVYAAMYGTDQGWTIPSDISYHWNGSERVVPDKERDAVANSIGNLLACDFQNVPTEVFAHGFHFMFKPQETNLGDFSECVYGSGKQMLKCRELIAEYCPQRFGDGSEETCRKYLWEKKSLLHEKQVLSDVNVSFQKHKKCMRKVRESIKDCIEHLYWKCKRSKIHSVKTVRMDMKTAGMVIDKYPNARIIHLIRDPRAVVLSRLYGPSFHSKYAGEDIVKEAYMYCSTVSKDIESRQKLELLYPGRTMQLIYEQLVLNPIDIVNAIYTFLDSPVPDELFDWLHLNTAVKKNSTKIASKWQQKVSYKEGIGVTDVCKELFDKIQDTWPQ